MLKGTECPPAGPLVRSALLQAQPSYLGLGTRNKTTLFTVIKTFRPFDETTSIATAETSLLTTENLRGFDCGDHSLFPASSISIKNFDRGDQFLIVMTCSFFPCTPRAAYPCPALRESLIARVAPPLYRKQTIFANAPASLCFAEFRPKESSLSLP